METPFDWATKEQRSEEETTPESSRRLYRLFKENPEGRALLNEWVGAFVFGRRRNMQPSSYELGYQDGAADLVKRIVLAINEVENG